MMADWKNAVRNKLLPAALMLLLLAAGQVLLPAQQPEAGQHRPLLIEPQPPPPGVVGQAYHFQLSASGGLPPVSWAVVEGNLPSGLQLDRQTGWLLGIPSAMGDFHFTVASTDSATPPIVARREFALRIYPALEIEWKPPGVQDTTISGQLTVTNNTAESVNATVIVVAVNEIGKAFVLGYEQLTVAPRSRSRAVLFSSALPYGSYIVHADTIAENPSTNLIYRARLQSAPIAVNPPF